MGHLCPSQFSRNMGQLPSHIFAALCGALTIPYIFNGASNHPIFLAAFHCTLHLPSLRGVYIHTGQLSFPFHHLIISLDSWCTYPSHSHFCSSNISHFRHTWSLYNFLLTALYYLWSILYNLSFFFSLYLHGFYLFFTESCLF